MNANYAILPNRIKAVVIDGIIIISAMYIISEVFALFDDVPNFLRATSFILVFLLYDPLFTSILGGTIGHSYSKITVKNEKNLEKNISFPQALIRFTIKSTLGWISLLTVTSNSKKQALHDLIAKSVVIDVK
jgi:uncharacterized RDD family membrane protein YckC